MISDRKSQFTAELMKELNKILRIEMKLLTLFHLQTDCKRTTNSKVQSSKYKDFYIFSDTLFAQPQLLLTFS